MKKKIEDYQNYIFDLDGTLYFHKPIKLPMAFRLLFYYGFRFWKMKELFILKKYRQLREDKKYENQNYSEENLFANLAKKYKTTPQKVASVVKNWMQIKPLKLVEKHKDHQLAEFIKQQATEGKNIIVYSDFPVKEKLEVLGLLDVVKHQFSATDAGIQCLKPNPQGLLHIIKQLKLDVVHTLFVGDRIDKDGACAKVVGMDFLILNKSKKKRVYHD